MKDMPAGGPQDWNDWTAEFASLQQLADGVAAPGEDVLDARAFFSGMAEWPPEFRSLRSSSGTLFAVVSSLQLVEGVEAPGEEQLDRLMRAVMFYVEVLEKQGAVIIADFEGEMPGHGGELVTAAFLPTNAVDKATLKWEPRGMPRTPGLLVDMRCRLGVKVAKKIMESTRLTKLIWGASADFQALMHQDSPVPLGMRPRETVDVQLAFSEPRRRLGMATMLERVPARFVEGLPAKDQIDFDAIYSRNRRALPLPLSRTTAAYAMDDLHRIEAILRSQAPPYGTYFFAACLTRETAEATRRDPLGAGSLQSKIARFRNRAEAISEGKTQLGVRQLAAAVRVKRHILSSRAKGVEAQQGGFFASSFLAAAEREVDALLKRNGVKVPADLSFWEPA